MSNPAETLNKKHAIGVKIARIGLGMIDYEKDTIHFDARGAALLDISSDEPVARSVVHARIHPDDRNVLDEHIKRMMDPASEGFFELNHRVVHENGNVLWLTARKQVEFGAPNADGSLHPASGLVAIIDITDHKSDQDRVQYLLDELNHRVKNLLSVVQGIARLTFSTGDVSTARERFSKRLGGLTHNLDALVKGDWTSADLSELVIAHLQGFSTNNAQINVDGPTVHLDPSQAQAIGMALHELATNAFKYGALSVETGTVTIAWHMTDDDQLCLTWSEAGGPPVTAPSQSGFGSKVIKEMTSASLRGEVEVDYRTEGLLWNVTFPLETSA
ncbi:HWE histidine kinase domain-containing protein [uncultured Sulfitobacter sp.]|uniref:sensor histidine kinase n=1 Tax=uncultured Sulfitobacter sp. TaxID=191468 RepID=UPI002611F57B|nr:HWE histidine kinase domain-containing protein [uncultured Sulfitobacter sp.]